MKSIFFIFSAVLLVADPSYAVCNRLYSDVGTRCLRFLPTQAQSWSEAQSLCDVLGGHLAQVDDCELLGAITTYIGLYNQQPDTGAYWIGASDVIEEGHFVWVSNLSLSVPSGVPFWGVESDGIREPNGGTIQNCVAIVASDGYHFHDVECDRLYGALCEQDVSSGATIAPDTTTDIPFNITTPPFTNGTNVADFDSADWKVDACPLGYTDVAGGCFLALANTVSTWNGARGTCSLNGGRLATVGDCNVLADLSEYLKGLSTLTGYWIGISDEVNEGIFQYTDGTLALLTSVFWGQTDGVEEPNGGADENCVALSAADDYYFHDENCTLPHAVLCQADPVDHFY